MIVGIDISHALTRGGEKCSDREKYGGGDATNPVCVEAQ